MAKDSTNTAGVGFAGLLAMVFITLKLLDKIDWSWWWVLSPIWIPAVFVFVAMIIAVVTAAISD